MSTIFHIFIDKKYLKLIILCSKHNLNISRYKCGYCVYKDNLQNMFKDIWMCLWSSSYRGNKGTHLCFHKCLKEHNNYTSRNIYCNTWDTDLVFLPLNISRCIFRRMVLIYTSSQHKLNKKAILQMKKKSI